MSERGYITVGRDVFDNPLLVDPVCFRAWIWLLAEAAWKPRRITVATGRSKVAIELDRGQLSYSRSYMATAWSVGIQRVRTILRQFEDAGMVHITAGKFDEAQPNPQSTHKQDTQTNIRTRHLPMLITVCSCAAIQFAQHDEGLPDNAQTNTQRKLETNQKHRNKELEERIRAPEEPTVGAWPAGAFAQWYAIYPKRKQRKAAEKAFDKVRKSEEIDLEGILSATRRHAAAMKAVEPRFIPYPATWLNTGSYLDEDDKPQVQQSIAPPEHDPSTFSDSEWAERLKMVADGSRWPEQHWGPSPGKPGCHVPRRLLVAPVENQVRQSAS